MGESKGPELDDLTDALWKDALVESGLFGVLSYGHFWRLQACAKLLLRVVGQWI